MKLRMKRLLFASLASVLAVSVLCGGNFPLPKREKASAASGNYVSTALAVPNGQFNENSAYSFPNEPAQWTGEALNGSSTANMYNGGVIMHQNTYNLNGMLESYHWGDLAVKPENPFSDKSRFPVAAETDSEYNALMINTKDATGAYAYTSASLTLEANTCYKITVYVLTFKFSSGGASIKLVDAETNLSIGKRADWEKGITDEKLMAFRSVDTSNYKNPSTLDWRPYTFNVQTSFVPIVIKVFLSVGDDSRESGGNTKGIAFFDNVTGTTISRQTFEENAVKHATDSNFLSYSFEEEAAERGKIESDNTSFIKNGNFTLDGSFTTEIPGGNKGLYGWERIDYTNGGNIAFGTIDAAGRPNQSNANHYQEPRVKELIDNNAYTPFTKPGDYNNTALGITHKISSASGLVSAPFTIQRFRYYRLSVWFLTLDGAQANIYLSMPNPDYKALGDAPRKVLSSMTALSSDENVNTENWKQASFYIKGSSVKDYQDVSLELWLGYGDSNASTTFSTGTVFFDRIEIQYLDTAEYNKYSSNGTAVTLDEFAAQSSISNGNFNEIEYQDIDKYFVVNGGNSNTIAPLNPSSWTFVNGQNKSFSPNAADFGYNDNAVIRGIVADTSSGIQTSGQHNVLKIENQGASAAGYSSSDISLSSNAYQKINVSVYTADGAKAFLQLTEGENRIALIENIDTKGAWVNYGFIVWTGDGVSLKLTLWNGWCGEQYNPGKNLSKGTVFFALADSASSTAEEYGAKSDGNDKKLKTVDLNSNFGLFDNSEGSLKTPYRYNLSSTDERNAAGGVLDTKNFAEGTISVPNPGSTDDAFRYILMVNNMAPAASKYTSVKSVSLSSSSYYQITVSVKTAGLSGTGDSSSYGAYIGLSGLKKDNKNDSAVISGIKDDKYTVYTFYIATGDEACTFNYELGLGDEKRPSTYTKGFAFFEDMSYKSISPMDYSNAGSERALKLSFITSEAETPENDVGKSFWDWYWLPTLLFGAALLFVLIALSVRKLVPALISAVAAHKRNRAASASFKRGEEESKRKPAVVTDDDEYIDIVETVKPKAAARKERAESEETKSGDAYDDYFED